MATLYQSYSLTESEFERPVTMLTQNVIIYSLRPSDVRCQNYTQNFISFTTVKNPKIAWQNPQIPSRPPNSQDLGENPKQCEHWSLLT